VSIAKIAGVSLPPFTALSRQGGYAHTLKDIFTPIWAGPLQRFIFAVFSKGSYPS
jgi:hypothetical protein